jgi:hypothetical protein
MAGRRSQRRVKTKSIKLTDTQLIVLSAAAQREDRCFVATKSLRGGAAVDDRDAGDEAADRALPTV